MKTCSDSDDPSLLVAEGQSGDFIYIHGASRFQTMMNACVSMYLHAGPGPSTMSLSIDENTYSLYLSIMDINSKELNCYLNSAASQKLYETCLLHNHSNVPIRFILSLLCQQIYWLLSLDITSDISNVMIWVLLSWVLWADGERMAYKSLGLLHFASILPWELGSSSSWWNAIDMSRILVIRHLTIQRARVEVSDINISSTIEHAHLRNAVTWMTLTISPLAVNLNIARQFILSLYLPKKTKKFY
jgi:hypothetical protein